jgi:hypothetical protein
MTDMLCRKCRHVRCRTCQSTSISATPVRPITTPTPTPSISTSSRVPPPSSSIPSYTSISTISRYGTSISLPLSSTSRVTTDYTTTNSTYGRTPPPSLPSSLSSLSNDGHISGVRSAIEAWSCGHCSFLNTRYSYMCEICLRDRDRSSGSPVRTNMTPPSIPSSTIPSVPSSSSPISPEVKSSSSLSLQQTVDSDSKRTPVTNGTSSNNRPSLNINGTPSSSSSSAWSSNIGTNGDDRESKSPTASTAILNGGNNGGAGDATLLQSSDVPSSRQAQWVYDNGRHNGSVASSRPFTQRWERFDEEYQDKIELAFIQKQVRATSIVHWLPCE